MTVSAAQLSLSYPKPRDVLRKCFRFARTDTGGVAKCVLPKGAIITGIVVTQDAAAVTNAANINLGWSGSASALLSAFSLPVSTVGQAMPGAAAGASLLAGTPLTEDKTILLTYNVASSTAGGTGWIQILYFIPGPGELLDD